jgi:hypothetical protein
MAKKKATTLSKPKQRPEREDPEYLNVSDLAKLFGVAKVTILRHLPNMRTVRFGRRVLVRKADADAYAASLIREPTHPKPPRTRRHYTEQRAAGAS